MLEKNNQSCVDSHVVQSRDLEQADIVGEADTDEIVETLETGKGTVDDANPQQETKNSFELIVEDKDSSASSKDVEFSAGTQDHTPKRPRLRRGSSALLRCSIPYAMGNCFGSPDATAKPPGPTKGLPTTRPKAIDSDGSGMQEKGDGPGPGGLVLEVPRLRAPPKESDGSGAKQEKGRGDDALFPGPCRVLEAPRLREFTLAELRAATRGFKREMMLGEGVCGRVYKGWVDERTLNPAKSNVGIIVAVKKFNPESISVLGLREWQSEVNFLSRLSHPNLVRLLGYCSEDRELLLVYEFMPKGSLEDHLFRRSGNFEALSWSRRLKIATGAARGLAFLHSSEKQVIYRNFKTSNILLDADFTAKLSDFGLARNGPSAGNSHVTTRVIGTYGYAAPEYIATGHLYVKSDVYSFGVVLLELLTGLRAHDLNRPSHQHNLVEWARPYLSGGRIMKLMDQRIDGQYHAKAALRATRLAGKCLAGDPRSRPSMYDVVDALEALQ